MYLQYERMKFNPIGDEIENMPFDLTKVKLLCYKYFLKILNFISLKNVILLNYGIENQMQGHISCL